MEGFERVLELLVALFGAIAWPLVALVALVALREKVVDLAGAVTEKIRSASEMSLGKEGLHLKERVDAAKGTIDSLREDVEQLKHRLAERGAAAEPRPPAFGPGGPGLGKTHLPGGAPAPAPPGGIGDELKKMAADYGAIRAPDYHQRVRLKNEAAREMADHVLARGVSRDALADQTDEGLILALAAVAHAAPEPGDADRLIRVADRARKLHVKYRICMALGRLAESNLVSPREAAAIDGVLDAYEKDADPSLKARVAQTRSQLKLAMPGGVG